MDICKQFKKEDLPKRPRPDVDLLFGSNGALAGMMYCDATEYGPYGEHDDQEGFLVLEGTGTFYADGKEYRVSADTALLIPAHVIHCFKKDPDSVDMKIFYFHAAV